MLNNIASTINFRILIFACLGFLSTPSLSGLLERDLDTSLSGIEAYYDDVLDVTWLADTNYAQSSGYVTSNNFGLMSHSDSLTWADQLSIAGYDNWRLASAGLRSPISTVSGSSTGLYDNGFNITRPTSELAYMFHVNLGNTGSATTNGTATGCGTFSGSSSDSCLQNTGSFENLTPLSLLWYSEIYDPSTDSSWMFSTYNGVQSWSASLFGQAWAVSDGDIAANTTVSVSEPGTLSLLILVFLGIHFSRTRTKKHSNLRHILS